MKGKSIIVIGLWFSLVLCGCNNNQKTTNQITVVNKLNKNIICIFGYKYPNLNLDFTSSKELKQKGDKYDIEMGQEKAIDTLGMCDSLVWNKYIKNSMLEVFVFDKDKLNTTTKLEDALSERYYFTYTQIKKLNGVITLQ